MRAHSAAPGGGTPGHGRSARRGASIYHGIRLGIWTGSTPGASRYRIRIGRSLALVLLEALPRDWLDAYLAWYHERGWDEEARRLREQWLAAQKVTA